MELGELVEDSFLHHRPAGLDGAVELGGVRRNEVWLTKLPHQVQLLPALVPAMVIEHQHQSLVSARRDDGILDVLHEAQEVDTICAVVHLEVTAITQAVANGTVECEVGAPILGRRDFELAQAGPCAPLGLPGVEGGLIEVDDMGVVVEDELPQFLSKFQAIIVKLSKILVVRV